MKKFRRLICFLLVLVSLSFFSACSKEEKNPQNETSPEIESGGGITGGDNIEEEDEDEPQEVYVPYSASEIMVAGSNLVSTFYNDYEVGLAENDSFDDNIESMKVVFLNASKMIKKTSGFDNLPFGYCVRGKSVVLENYEEKPNKIERFDANFITEDLNGNSSVKLKIVFSYEGQDVQYRYDYYDILIQTNKAQKKVSCEIFIERSVNNGLNDSTANYYILKLNGNIGDEYQLSSFDCYKFYRKEFIDAHTSVNYNNIDNFEHSKFEESFYYMGTVESKNLLRNSNSSVTQLVATSVGTMNQGYKSLFNGGVMGSVSGLSELLIDYVNEDVEIS